MCRITCADRALDLHTLNATCVERDVVKGTTILTTVSTTRCIDVPPNECRMRPIDTSTGKTYKRKFTVKKEGIKERWW